MIKSLHCHKLSRQNRENAEEWQIKEQFIHGLKDTEMLGKIIKEVTKICENEEITSKNVLSWVQRVEVQRAQSAVMNSLRV